MADWHLITCEYPPQIGGVSDYTFVMARELARAGDQVHVWCGRGREKALDAAGVIVHEELGDFSPGDLWHTGSLLNKFPGPRRLFVQWVPHGYGYRSMNVFFCLWLWMRARVRRDEVHIMFHEVWLAFGGNWRANGAATVHRVMVALLKRAASKIWISGEAWRKLLQPARPPVGWLPVPSNIPSGASPDQVAKARERFNLGEGRLIGHFGSGNTHVDTLLRVFVPDLLRKRPSESFLVIGKGSEGFYQWFRETHPDLGGRVFCTGLLSRREIAACISACDLIVQPYVDGISTRRTAAMAALANGRPLLTTGAHSTEQFWFSQTSVAVAPAGDVGMLVARAEELLDDSAERARMAESGKRLYETLFSVSLSVDVLRGTRLPLQEESIKQMMVHR